eukprot:7185258-Heterocapsa_arctica.AAC.1
MPAPCGCWRQRCVWRGPRRRDVPLSSVRIRADADARPPGHCGHAACGRGTRRCRRGPGAHPPGALHRPGGRGRD